MLCLYPEGVPYVPVNITLPQSYRDKNCEAYIPDSRALFQCAYSVGGHSHRICIFDIALHNVVHLRNFINKEGWKMSCLYPQEFVLNTGFSLKSLEVIFQAEIWGLLASHVNVGFLK